MQLSDALSVFQGTLNWHLIGELRPAYKFVYLHMPKRVLPLRDDIVKAAKPRDKTYTMADGAGLYIQITPLGAKLWRWKYKRPNGKMNLLSLGRFPDINVERARVKRYEAARQLEMGIDPARVRQEQRSAAKFSIERTFERVARDWHEANLEQWQPSTAEDILHRLEIHVFPYLGNAPIRDISHAEWLRVFRRIESKGARETAHRICGVCSRVYQYAIRLNLVERNVPGDVSHALKRVIRKHIVSITPDQLGVFAMDLRRNRASMSRIVHIATELMMLVFVRTSELIEAKWEEIDFDNAIWTIPWYRMKRGRRRENPDKTDHVVFLARQSLELLRELRSITGMYEYVFASASNGRRPISNGAILQGLKRMGYSGKMTGHGFRSLAMTTVMEKLNVPFEVVDRQLAHQPQDKTERAYNRTRYMDERKRLMQLWADYLDSVVEIASESTQRRA